LIRVSSHVAKLLDRVKRSKEVLAAAFIAEIVKGSEGRLM